MLRRSVLQSFVLKRSVVKQPIAFRDIRDASSWQQWTEKRFLSRSTAVASESSKAAKGSHGEDDLDKPIQFTTSKAARFTAQHSLGGNPFPNAPWYQPFVVSLSVGVFLLYFLVLREENDIDEYMGVPLWEKVPGLEKQQLHVVLDYNRAHNIDTTDIERRLEELEMQSQQIQNQVNK